MLMVFTVVNSITMGEKFIVLSREAITRGEDEWIIQLGITNKERRYQLYHTLVHWRRDLQQQDSNRQKWTGFHCCTSCLPRGGERR
ncbi:hypothetical protein ACFLTK_01040 [Chloroflexota bacterium]